jgi:hypothetical protein
MHRRICAAFLFASALLLSSCGRGREAAKQEPPPPSLELEKRLGDTEERLRRTEGALAKSQDAIRDLQARINQRPAAQPDPKPQQPEPQQPRPEPPPPMQITLAKYNAVDAHPLRLGFKVSMSYEEVVKIMEVEGVEKSSDGRASTVAWENGDGAKATITFEIIDKHRYAISKSQHGLK